MATPSIPPIPPDRAAQTSARKRRPTTLSVALLLLLLVAAGLGWWFFGRTAKVPVALPPIEVQVTQALSQAMPVVLQSVGKVVAQATVEVRPQTGGVLRQVFIQDGARVVAGQKLFALDAQPLASALVQAQAQWARDTALADEASAAQARLKPLAEKEYVTAQEYATAVSNSVSLRATAAATRTLIEQARIALAFATITAPISGRAGQVLAKPGALVAVGGTTPLVVINALSPIEVVFSLPQDTARRLRDAMAAAPATPMAVEARDSLSQKVRAVGALVFVDNALGDQSGAIAVKARFANADEALWPGEFYAMRITLATQAAAVTVPERTLQQGQSGPYVYVVQGGVAKIRPLTLDRVLDGVAVITSGLQAGEMVLAAIPNNLRDGSAVRVATPPATAPAAVDGSTP
jgi:RND family efflux transporter MFP subunit